MSSLIFIFFTFFFPPGVVLAMVFRVIGKVRWWEQNKMAIDCLYLSFTTKFLHDHGREFSFFSI